MWNKLMKIFFGDKKTSIKKQIDKKYTEAISYQRNGNIRKYSELMSEISKLEDEYDRL